MSTVEQKVSWMENSGWRLTNVRLALFFATQGSMVFVSGLLIECADSGYSLLWPAAGVGFAALATVQRDSWRRLLAGHVIAVALASLLLGRHPAATSVGFGVVGALELFVAVSVYLRLTRGSPTLQGAAELVKLVIASALGVSLVALFGGLLLRGDNRFESAAVAAQFFSHLSGIVMLAPIFLVERRRVVPPGRWPEIVLQGATLAVVLALVSQGGSRPLGFLPFAALAWAAARMRPRLTAIELFVSAVVINVTTLRGWGPFAEYGRELGNAHLGSQLSVVYQLTLLVTILPLALTVNRDRHTAVSLSASEDMYRRTFDDAMLGMVMLERSSATHGGSFIARVNPVASQFLAANASEVLGTGLLDHLFATDQEPVGAALSEVFAGTLDTWSGHVQLAGQTYDELHVSMTLSPLRGEHGQVDRVAVQMADVTNAHHAAERLADLALHDPLTGLANRTLLEDRLQHWLGIGTRECTQVLVLYIDLDDFKIVNDSAGHETGDQLLLEVSRRLVEALRPHDTVARLGGDEFVVIAPKMAGDSAPASNVVSTRLLTALSAPYHIHGETYSVGASIGMTLSRNGSTPTSLMREADSAMYEAKRKGKNCRHLFVESTDTVLTDRARMVGQLNEAFTKDQFELHIQPLIDLASGTVVGGEALIRWRHPELGLLPPASWLSIAEDSDLVHRLGSWVILEACRQAARWERRMGLTSPIVHANVSAKQLGHGTLLDDVRGALARTGLSPEKLVLELTETQLERPDVAVQADFDGLRAAGIQIAADDFGTGYSSLTRLTDMPIDILKIDRTFVARMSCDDRARAVVAALVTMGSTIGIEVVAEGVETADEATHLRELGCDQAQGFLWSQAVPGEEFLELAIRHVAVVDDTAQTPRVARHEVVAPARR